MQPKMVLAFRANAPVGFEVFFPDCRAAILALGPQAFRLYAALVRRSSLIDPFFFAFKPSHKCFSRG
jgi:hypothetical protein